MGGSLYSVSLPPIRSLAVTDDDVLPYLEERLPDFSPAGAPRRLPEGNLNFVWRVPGEERSVIVKHAPPYIAVDPDTPLDPRRLEIEARCLKVLGPGGALASVSTETARTPQVIDVNVTEHILIMEDVGEVPTLGRWLREQEAHAVRTAASTIGRRLGAFIGRLHTSTCQDTTFAETFDNRAMQVTRLAVQYRGVSDMLERGGVSDAASLGRRAEALGDALLEPGRCLTMGDLWPSSVLVRGKALRLIDWELAHYGRPLQDVAHWEAHLWMQRHRAPTDAVADAVSDVRRSFLDAYWEALGEDQNVLWSDDERRAAALHFGAELLVRAVGPFQEGYVYAGLAPEHPHVQEAVTTAARMLRAPDSVDVLERETSSLS